MSVWTDEVISSIRATLQRRATSDIAFQEMIASGSLSKNRRTAYEYVKAYPRSTRDMVGRAFPFEADSVGKRCQDLVRMGLLVEDGLAQNVSEMWATAYRVSEFVATPETMALFRRAQRAVGEFPKDGEELVRQYDRAVREDPGEAHDLRAEIVRRLTRRRQSTTGVAP